MIQHENKNNLTKTVFTEHTGRQFKTLMRCILWSGKFAMSDMTIKRKTSRCSFGAHIVLVKQGLFMDYIPLQHLHCTLITSKTY